MDLAMGSWRIRVPVAAAMALVSAGAAVGTLTSPTPVGDSPDWIYLTIQALAEAVHAGLADADEATREVLEKVWEIEHRSARPHLTVVPEDAGEGGAW